MRIHYFADTDTLSIELNENTLVELDADGNICALTVEHVTERRG